MPNFFYLSVSVGAMTIAIASGNII